MDDCVHSVCVFLCVGKGFTTCDSLNSPCIGLKMNKQPKLKRVVGGINNNNNNNNVNRFMQCNFCYIYFNKEYIYLFIYLFIKATSVVQWSEYLTTDSEVSGSIPSATRAFDK
jgi:hypothetical protein